MQVSRLTLKMLILAVLMTRLISGCGGGDEIEEGNISQKVSREDLDLLHAIYNFKLEKKDGAGPRFSIEFTFVMPSKRIYLQLPNRFLRKERLYDRLEDLEVVKGNATLSDHERPDYKLLAGEKNEKVTIRYYLRGDDPQKTGSKDSFSAPIVQANFFMFVGQMALIIPSGLSSNEQEFSIDLNWEMPAGFEVFNSFGAKKFHQKIITSGVDLWDSVFLGSSDIRSRELDINGKPVTITYEGAWDKISDDEFADTVGRLIKTQRDAWRDNNFPYFLVSFLALGDGCENNKGHKFAGTAHKNSFRAFFPSDCQLEPSMKQLISHELMHNWIGKKIKMGEERGHIDGKWWTEGLTDFFGRKFALRAGVINEREYFETLNRVLHNYQVSSERQAPIKKLVAHMYKKPFTNQDLEQLPYQQGELLALQLNKKIKERSNFKNSLDDAIRDMLYEAEKAGGSKNFTPEEVGRIVDRYAPGVFNELYTKIKEGNAPLVVPSLAQCSEPEATDRLVINGRVHQTRRTVYAYTRFDQCDQWLK